MRIICWHKNKASNPHPNSPMTVSVPCVWHHRTLTVSHPKGCAFLFHSTAAATWTTVVPRATLLPTASEAFLLKVVISLHHPLTHFIIQLTHAVEQRIGTTLTVLADANLGSKPTDSRTAAPAVPITTLQDIFMYLNLFKIQKHLNLSQIEADIARLPCRNNTPLSTAKPITYQVQSSQVLLYAPVKISNINSALICTCQN